MPRDAPISQLIQRWSSGDARALEELVPLVYDDLKAIASRHLARQGLDDRTLNTTALVHELYMNLVDQSRVTWNDRAHFFAVASKAMRHLVIDYVRARGAEKRGGDRTRVPLFETAIGVESKLPDLLALDEALTRLSDRDGRLGQVVECRFFGGMNADETARALGVGKRTVERDWARARAYLFRELS